MKNDPFDPLGLFNKKPMTAHEKLKKEAIDNDRRLQDLATYELTKGLTIPVPDNKQLLCKFAEYKRRIQLGSFTLEQLEDFVLCKYAITSNLEWNDPLKDVEFLEEEPEPYWEEE
jgi:hypothetical protein